MGLCLPASVAAKWIRGARAAWPAAARGLLVRLACVALLAPCAQSSLAAPQLAAPSIPYPTGAGSRWVATGDLDLDGVPDLVTANSSDNTVSVLIGRGDGTFLPRVDSPTGVGWVALADINADGMLDAVTLNPAADTFSTLLGTGTARFGRTANFALGRRALWLAIGDLDRDGLPDLVTYADTAVSVRLGLGDGTFLSPAKLPIGHAAGSAAIGDLDRDGIPDLVVAEPGVHFRYEGYEGDTIRFSVMRGNGDGTFAAGAVCGFVTASGFMWSISLDDVNGDGKLDVVGAVTASEGSVGPLSTWGRGIVYYGNGDGTFGDRTGLPRVPESDGFGVTSVRTANLNGDRNVDLVVTTGGAASVWLGRGNGIAPEAVVSYSNSGPIVVAVDDLDGDGLDDLACVDGGDVVSVLIGNGDGSFGRGVTGGLAFSPISVVSGDVNGDGILDLVTTHAPETYITDANRVEVLIADGHGAFAPVWSSEFGDTPAAGRVLVLGDLNGDQAPDLLATRGGGLFVVLGNGSGVFGRWIGVDGENPYGNAAIGDLNGDGHLDLVALGMGGAAVLLGNGDGTFAPAVVYEPGTVFRGAIAEDLDGDGHADLVLMKAGAVAVMLGAGAGGFSPRRDFAPGNDPVALAAGDLNGDGRIDLVVVGEGPVATLLGHGDGSFTLAGTVPVPAIPGPPAIGDLDGDGVPDVALTINRNVGVMLGAGDGTLGAPFLFSTTGLAPFWTGIHDWNGDGHPDLGVAHAGRQYSNDGDGPLLSCIGATIAVLFNQGPSQPETPLVARMDARPGSCASPLNLRSRGVFPVTLLGTPDFNVREIDLSTVALEGTARAVHHVYQDRLVATEASQSECTCAKARRDGREDLTLHFDTEALARAGLVRGRRQETRLTVTGRLASGRLFEASDCVEMVGSAVARPLEAFGGAQAALQGVRYEVAQAGPVELVVCDVRGRIVRRLVTGPQAAGTHETRWDATGVPSGIYFYRLATGPRVEMGKVLLMK